MRWSSLEAIRAAAGVLTLFAVCVLIWFQTKTIARIDNVTRLSTGSEKRGYLSEAG